MNFLHTHCEQFWLAPGYVLRSNIILVAVHDFKLRMWNHLSVYLVVCPISWVAWWPNG